MFHVSYDGVLRHSREQGNNWQVLNSPFEGVNYTTSLRLAYGWRHLVHRVARNAMFRRRIQRSHADDCAQPSLNVPHRCCQRAFTQC